jgi:hypothetical protein
MFTKQAAERVFLRPCLIIDLLQSAAVDRASEWLARTIGALDIPEFVLNIAGPRESDAPGIYSEVGGFLTDLFTSMQKAMVAKLSVVAPGT